MYQSVSVSVISSGFIITVYIHCQYKVRHMDVEFQITLKLVFRKKVLCVLILPSEYCERKVEFPFYTQVA